MQPRDDRHHIELKARDIPELSRLQLLAQRVPQGQEDCNVIGCVRELLCGELLDTPIRTLQLFVEDHIKLALDDLGERKVALLACMDATVEELGCEHGIENVLDLDAGLPQE